MTENQLLKLWLIEKFAIGDEPKTIEVCQEVYKFVVEGKQEQAAVSVSTGIKDGVYFVGIGNSIVPCGAVPKAPKDTTGVLLVQGERSIVIALKDIGTTELTTRTDPANLQGNYIDEYIDAVADWNGKRNTEHLKAVGLKPGINLDDGAYIPSMGEILFIFAHRKEVNEALAKANGQPIADSWYWTSTEYSATNAWYLCLYNGYMANSRAKAATKIRVRPVSAFIA